MNIEEDMFVFNCLLFRDLKRFMLGLCCFFSIKNICLWWFFLGTILVRSRLGKIQ